MDDHLHRQGIHPSYNAHDPAPPLTATIAPGSDWTYLFKIEKIRAVKSDLHAASNVGMRRCRCGDLKSSGNLIQIVFNSVDLSQACKPAGSSSQSVRIMPIEVGPKWYVIETLPQKELCAVENLQRQGFDVFFPRFRKLRRHARKEETVLAAVFPGYMFVHMMIENVRWARINSTRGVKRIVSFGERRPQPVDSESIELLLQRCEQGVMTQMLRDFSPGDHVKMNTGPLADLVAKIESLDAKGRINLLFQIMGCDRIITVPSSSVRPAST